MIVLKSCFHKAWQFLYSYCLTWIEEKVGSFWLREGSASPSAAPTGKSRTNGISNHRSWRLLHVWTRVGPVGQSGNPHRSGAGSSLRSIRYEHAPSLSSRTCHLQISARKKRDHLLSSLKLQWWDETEVVQETLSEIRILCTFVINGIFTWKGFCDLYSPSLWDYQDPVCRNCPAQPHTPFPLQSA